MKAKKKTNKLPMSLTKRIVLSVLAIAAVIGLIYLAYYFIHYVWYDGYKEYLTSYEYETGTECKLTSETSSDVPGMQLVCENEYLKLYTDTASATVAVYDKRNGSITYSNPMNADEDSIANRSNKNYLKSQMMVYYYNSSVTSGVFDSYSKSVATGQYDYEGIQNGIRYVYTVGDIVDKNGAEGIHFDIPLEYRLDGDSLVVSIPACGIKEYGNASVYRIQLLRYMGAASSAEDGYLVVPNGSGSIINFNNGKTTAANYSQYIYDIDPMAATYTMIENVDGAKLPIYGICRNDRTLLVTVEDGATTSVITAGISGVYNNYNYAYTTFVLRNIDNLRMFGNSSTDVYVLEENMYDINYTVRYSFLTEENKGYNGLANYYRNRLIAEGVLSPATENGNIPLYYDIIGGIKKTSHILGVQYLHTYAMTTFDAAGEIATALSESGISNQVMNFQGWFNGAYYNNATDKVKVLSKLGGKSDLAKLNQTMQNLGGELFADVIFQQISFSDDSFNYEAESSRYYGAGYVASFGLTNPADLRNTAGLRYYENMYDVLSPKFLPRYVQTFIDKVEKYEISGISLRDLGSYLSSDKRRTNVINREAAMQIVKGQLQRLEDTGKDLMTNAANAYSFAYSSDIINVPTDHNEYAIVDASIPLYQMIIHGSISYSGKLLNYENTEKRTEAILEMIETGTAPHYVFTWEASNEMKDTAISRFYATTFTTWKDDAVETYKQVNEALKHVSGALMINHEILDNNVRKVTYDNGVIIYINYDEEAHTVDGITIPAMSYGLEGI